MDDPIHSDRRLLQPHRPDDQQDVEVVCPPDKSVTHRAMIFSAIAKGVSRIEHPLLGQDCLATVTAFRKLGVEVEFEAEEMVVNSPGMSAWRSPETPLDCGNSGTTARLLCGLFAGCEGLRVTLVGDESLSSRPMERVVAPLREMGAKITGKEEGRFLPLIIDGRKLVAKEIEVSKASAQVKSALLLASFNVSSPVSILLPKGSRDHTERMLKALGANLSTREVSGKEELRFVGPFMGKARNWRIPGDPSSAAFLHVLGAIRPSCKTSVAKVMVNKTRCGYLDVMAASGLSIKHSSVHEEGFVEPVCTVEIEGGQLIKPLRIDPEQVPTLVDEIPILAVLAVFARGESCFRGLGELRVKESDRLEKTAELVRLAGASARIEGDDLYIGGGVDKVGAFTYDSAGDHRLAMAASILATRAGGPCKLDGSSCVDVSFPGFYALLEKFVRK